MNIKTLYTGGWLIGGVLLALLFIPTLSSAQDFVYKPVNPAFGGNYLNYNWLMSGANTQNEHRSSTSSRVQDPLADFQERLQRQILSQLSRELVTERFGEVDFNERNTFSFGDFNIEVIPGGDGVTIDIFNTLTGDQTSVTIPEIY